MSVPSSLGLDPTVANSGKLFHLTFNSQLLHVMETNFHHLISIICFWFFVVHRLLNTTIGSIFPSGLQKTILDRVFSLGRAQLSESLLNERNPLGSLRLRTLKTVFEEGRSLQLQFPAEDLGFRYHRYLNWLLLTVNRFFCYFVNFFSVEREVIEEVNVFRYLEGALVPDNESTDANLEVPTGRRRDYVPCADPGSRLPHTYVKILSDSPNEVLNQSHLLFPFIRSFSLHHLWYRGNWLSHN